VRLFELLLYRDKVDKRSGSTTTWKQYKQYKTGHAM